MVEIRNPKSEIREKTEIRNGRTITEPRWFGLRISGFLRASAFGFRIFALLFVALFEFLAFPAGKQLTGAYAPATTPALSPAEAEKKFVVPPGFEVRLFAGEPDVINPVAMTW